MTQHDYLSQTDLGKLFGVSSHVIGKWLKDCGLRTPEGWPTWEAKEQGYVMTAPNGRDTGWFNVWRADITAKALEEAGHKRIDLGSPLVGPFSSDFGDDARYAIRGSDGAVNVWVRGKENAERIVKLLDLAHEYGKLGSAN